MINSIRIKNKIVSEKKSAFIVAEISGNHGGSITNLKKLILKAKLSGCDAVKIQAYEAETITLKSYNKDFLISKKNTWKKYKNLYNLYKKAQTPFEWYKKIFNFCRKINIIVFASVFDLKSLQILKKLNCPAYKIASPEITDINLISNVAKTGKPIIISNGLGNYLDLKLAIKEIRKVKNNKIIILKCTSAYPAPIDEINLKTMKEIKKKFKCLVGYSDHTLGIQTAIHSASLGATLIEKHICLNKKNRTVDSFFSETPENFRKMIDIIKDNFRASGKITFEISKSSKVNLNGRRSLYIVKDIKKGSIISKKNIRSVRPSFGLHPKFLLKILNKKVKKDLWKGDPLRMQDIYI